MPSGKLGYDRAIVVFSPDGRLFQVEYAREAVKRGPTSLGIVYDKGVVFAALKYTDELSVDNRANNKLHQIDDHIATATTGIIADSRVLVDKARVKAQVYRITYEEPISIYSLVKELADYKQMHTQIAGMRPMGISFLVGGVHGGEPSLFETDPGGAMFEWKAQVIGRDAEDARKHLEENWEEGMSKEDALQLAVDSIKEGEKEVDVKSLDLASIEEDNGFERISNEDKEEYL
ncbi:MAG: archaeal proteasome endopeptidase complex subunit alpha [Candidatus Aenigmatarchaeota archaeon]